MRVRKITKTWMLLVGTVVLCLTGCGKETQTADFSGVTSVCELATLKCYYHNVAKAETEASGIFAKWLKTGYKKIWTEYSGIIEYGIDISQVTVSKVISLIGLVSQFAEGLSCYRFYFIVVHHP